MSSKTDFEPANLNGQIFIQPLDKNWKLLEKEKGIPVPQGNLPMMKFLKPEKQFSLLRAYNDVMKE
jgi:hypothetical protein